jgi:hypothetical protein
MLMESKLPRIIEQSTLPFNTTPGYWISYAKMTALYGGYVKVDLNHQPQYDQEGTER